MESDYIKKIVEQEMYLAKMHEKLGISHFEKIMGKKVPEYFYFDSCTMYWMPRNVEILIPKNLRLSQR